MDRILQRKSRNINFNMSLFVLLANVHLPSISFVCSNCALDALIVFQHMKSVNVIPNSVTLVSLLSACSRLFNIGVGESIHSQIIVNNIRLDVALGTSLVEMSFVGACKDHGQAVFLDEDLRKFLLQIEPDLGANYVLAACVSSVSENWDDASGLRVAMKGRALKKVPGCSWVEVKSSCAGPKSVSTSFEMKPQDSYELGSLLSMR
ncbi:hypothetical protein U1Q18_025548 [Sarracenia purpurea var. burkii]